MTRLGPVWLFVVFLSYPSTPASTESPVMVVQALKRVRTEIQGLEPRLVPPPPATTDLPFNDLRTSPGQPVWRSNSRSWTELRDFCHAVIWVCSAGYVSVSGHAGTLQVQKKKKEKKRFQCSAPHYKQGDPAPWSIKKKRERTILKKIQWHVKTERKRQERERDRRRQKKRGQIQENESGIHKKESIINKCIQQRMTKRVMLSTERCYLFC